MGDSTTAFHLIWRCSIDSASSQYTPQFHHFSSRLILLHRRTTTHLHGLACRPLLCNDNVIKRNLHILCPVSFWSIFILIRIKRDRGPLHNNVLQCERGRKGTAISLRCVRLCVCVHLHNGKNEGRKCSRLNMIKRELINHIGLCRYGDLLWTKKSRKKWKCFPTIKYP